MFMAKLPETQTRGSCRGHLFSVPASASLSKAGVAADGDNSPKRTGTGEDSDSTHLSTAVVGEQQWHQGGEETKPARAKMVTCADGEAGLGLQDSAGKQTKF